MIIKTDHLYRIYNNKKIIDGVSLTFDEGKIYVIRGVSGAGKTTFLNLISLMARPDEGRVIIDEIDPWEKNIVEDIRKRCSIILQNSFLINELTLGENLLLGSDLNKLDDRCHLLLEQASLKDKINNKAKTLSVGEKQRVNLVRALIREPEVIFADEPVASLDDKNREFVKDRLLEFVEKQGKTLFIITHYDHIESDRVVFLEMDNGSVKQRNTILR